MISPPLPGSLSRVEKTAGVGSTIRRVLLGNKRLRPSELADVRRYVTAEGAPLGAGGGLLRNLLVGSDVGGRVLSSRFAQGGIFGKGGVLRGELAPDPELVASLGRILQGRAVPGVVGLKPGGGRYVHPGDYLRSAGLGANYALNVGLGLGVPYLGAKAALEDSSGEGVGRAIGEGLGYLAGGPLGLVGLGVGGALGGSAGGRLGAALSPDPLPASVYRSPSLEAPLPSAYQAELYPNPSGTTY